MGDSTGKEGMGLLFSHSFVLCSNACPAAGFFSSSRASKVSKIQVWNPMGGKGDLRRMTWSREAGGRKRVKQPSCF